MNDNPQRDRVATIVNAAQRLEQFALRDFLRIECGDNTDLRQAVENELAGLLSPPASGATGGADCRDDKTIPPGALIFGAQLGDAALRDDDTIPPTSNSGADSAITDDDTIPPDSTATQTDEVNYSKKFGDYELIRELGRGGMGVIFKARQASLDRVVALKMILAGRLASEEEVRRFKTEAEAAARLEHVGIVPIYEVGEHDGQHFFSMGLVEGPSLKDKLTDGPLPPKKAAALVQAIAEPIAYAHGEGLIHRDIKPANILIGRDARPRITDFGLAKNIQSDKDMTATGEVIGTPSYMPPEQAAGDLAKMNETSDIYSLGAILYELITGRPPFHAASALDTLLQLLEKDPVSPRQLNPNVDKDLETICLKCLEKEQHKRYSSVDELIQELDAYQRDRPIKARPIGGVGRLWRWCKRNPVVAALAGTLTVASVIGFVTTAVMAILAFSWFRAESQARDRADWLVYGGQIKLAQSEWESGDAVLARNTLQQCDLPFRGWEHDYLTARFHQNQETYHGHEAYVHCATFSADGEVIVSGGWDRQIVVWNRKSNEIERRLRGHNGVVRTVAMTRQGKKLFSAGDDQQIIVWNLKSGEKLEVLAGHTRTIESVTVSHDDTLLASGGADGTVRIWDAQEHSLIREISAPAVVNCLRFSPDGTRLAAACGNSKGPVEECQVVIWDTATGNVLRRFEKHQGPVNALAFAPDGNRLLCGCGSLRGGIRANALAIWNLESGEAESQLDNPPDPIHAVDWSPSGQHVLAAINHRIAIWDATSGELLGNLKGHLDIIPGAVFSEDGEQVVSASWDKSVRLWKLSATQTTNQVRNFNAPLTAVSVGPGGARVATADESGKVWVTNVQNRSTVARFDEHSGAVPCVRYSSNGTYVASGGTDKTVRLWDVANKSPSAILRGHQETVTSLAFSEDNRLLLSGSEDRSVRLWDINKAKAINRFVDHDRPVNAVAFGAFGRFIASGATDKVVCIRDLRRGSVRRLEGHTGAITSLAFSPDDRTLVSGSDDKTVRVWDVRSGKLRFVLKGHTSSVSSVAIGPADPRVLSGESQRKISNLRIVSSSTDRTIKIWSLDGGSETLTLKGHQGPVTDAQFFSRCIVLGQHQPGRRFEIVERAVTAWGDRACATDVPVLFTSDTLLSASVMI